MAPRAALLRLAGAGRPRRLVHARRPHPGCGPVPAAQGQPLQHDKLLAFIERNYGHDDRGAWFFQNGPQRVYLELEAAPWVWRLAGDFSVRSHTGEAARVQAAWLDEPGRLFLDTDIGFGLVHTLDTGIAADAIEQGLWAPGSMPFAAMPQRFGYVLKPAAAGGAGHGQETG